MINLIELRIGNWINGDREGNFQLDTNNRFVVEANEHHYQPIPLTPEIFEKCGFAEMKDGEKGIGVFVNGIYDFEEIILDEGEYALAIHEEYINTSIKYLHQLQNLYFALTGLELTFKQPI